MPAATVTDLPPGQVTPDHSVPWQVELEKVLAGAPAAIEAVAALGCLPLCRPARAPQRWTLREAAGRRPG